MRGACYLGVGAAAVCLTLVLTAVPPLGAQESPTLAALQDELKRSIADLRMKDEPPPYYIAYEVEDMSDTSLQAKLGALVEDGSRRFRALRVEVRVGDYAFDSSRFFSGNRGGGSDGAVLAPLDDDYDAMRRQLWLATDAAYKRAVNVFARKKAAFQNRAGTESIPDFSKEAPVETVLPGMAPGRPNQEWVDRVRQISAVFASAADIHSSDVSLSETRGTRYYVNSEGFKSVVPIQSVSLRVAADTQSDDGTVLRDSFSLVENRAQDLPTVAEIVERSRDLATRLSGERRAPIGEEYTGPVLIEGEAASDLIAEELVPLMLARRAPDADNPRATQAAQSQITPFLTRIGLRVLPDAFSVSDTPSLTVYGGRPVPGAFAVDDEGVKAKDVSLVENGKLVTLLTSRTPQRKLLQSNGHGRGGAAQAGVFQMRSAQAVPAAELKAKYLELLKAQDKPFGYIVRGIGSASGQGAAGPVILQLARVTPDGKEDVVRGLRFATIAPTAFRNILDASEERELHSYFAGPAGTVVSVVAPNLIFEELEIQKVQDVNQRPPIVPSPLKD
jgi:predicted Zn-dependent protease